MYVVYKITNLINDKCYIGSSTKVSSRWKQHINSSKNINSAQYNYPLYVDMRQYGLNNFKFEILADDFSTSYDMEEYEYAMIKKYNSLVPNGYNRTNETHVKNIAIENILKHTEKVSKKCAKVDKCENIIAYYESYHDASRQNGYTFDCASNIRKVCKGETSSLNGDIFRDLDEDGNVISKPIKSYKGKKAIVGFKLGNPEEEIYFNSILDASKQLNVERQSITKCIKGCAKYSNVSGYVFRELDICGDIIEPSNLTVDEVLHNYEIRNPVIDGVRHSITEWCEIYNIKYATVNARIHNGMSATDAIITPVRRKLK